MALLAVALCVNFAACSDDDDDNPEQGGNPLIGTWISEPSTVGLQHDYFQIVFNDNGTAKGSLIGSDGVNYGSIDFTYTYDGATQMVRMTETATGASVSYAINSISGNEINLTVRGTEGTFSDDDFIYVITDLYRK